MLASIDFGVLFISKKRQYQLKQSGINANIRPKQIPFLSSSTISLHRIIARQLFSQAQRPFNLAHCRLALLVVALIINTDILLGQCILAVQLASISSMSSQ